MPSPELVLARFAITRPRHELDQERALAWIAATHADAEAARAGLDRDARDAFEARLARVIRRVACGADRIARRGHAHPLGTAGDRVVLYDAAMTDMLARAYAGEAEPPDDLIHVTCTGYSSPSTAQVLVAERRWRTRVTHAYQMGCYAAIPALRIAAGFAGIGARRVDVFHGELCSLHFDPADHAIEQLVVQSLFGDGGIRYELHADDVAPALRVHALHEQLVPGTAAAMSWRDMKMRLARDVPERIAGVVRGFVQELYARAGMGLGALPASVFAIHPGGPKIIDRVRATLELTDAQVAASRAVLRDHGNMSSATLPHIWQRVLADPRVVPGTLVASLAFGPGLTICGALLEKR
ncbi:MAG: 3-oxoacyl-[acyl-carrier-protein] synthase III C-terminal domain-containing protein [Acidobacteriota bacterium]